MFENINAIKTEVWPAAASLPLPLGIGANENANSLQQSGGF